MLRYLLLFSATAYSSAWWPVLPGIAVVLSVLLIFACCTAVFRNAELAAPARDLLALWAGVAWASIWGGFLLAHALPLGLDKSDYHVVGVVAGLPEQTERSTRFVFDVQSLEALSPNAGTEEPPALKRLRLNWYGAPPVEVGQRWQLSVRLRTPRGLSIPAVLIIDCGCCKRAFPRLAMCVMESGRNYLAMGKDTGLIDTGNGFAI